MCSNDNQPNDDLNETPNRLVDALNKQINYFRMEYDLNYSTVIGCLEIIKYMLLEEMDVDDDIELDEELDCGEF